MCPEWGMQPPQHIAPLTQAIELGHDMALLLKPTKISLLSFHPYSAFTFPLFRGKDGMGVTTLP